MAKTTVRFKLDEDIKNEVEKVCSEQGISMSEAFILFAKKVVEERHIPFEITADPFYSASNIRHLENIMQQWKNGTAHFEEHELIEVEE